VTGATPGPQYPKICSGPWSEGLDQVSSPEPLVDQTDCGDTYVGEPLGTPVEATSALSTPYAQTGRRGSHTPASPPVERSSASPGGVSLSTSNFKRRV
jgi:hypothetical protein